MGLGPGGDNITLPGPVVTIMEQLLHIEIEI